MKGGVAEAGKVQVYDLYEVSMDKGIWIVRLQKNSEL